MDEYLSKNDVIKYLNDTAEVCKQDCEFVEYENIMNLIREIKSNEISVKDVAEVVRCKDCKFRKTEDCAMYCECQCGYQFSWETDNDFCSWGQRKEQDNG